MITHRPNLFYALWPDDATRTELTKLQAHVNGRLTRPQNLHLTLVFLGPQPDALLPILRSVLAQLESAPIDIDIDRLGYFSKNRIAWAGAQTMPNALLSLQKKLVQALSRKGIPCAIGKTFNPHITLARKAAAPSERPFTPLRWQADQIVLAQSPQPDELPYYRVLAAQPCNAPSPENGPGNQIQLPL
jgi:RNA 2',3'-cyclic 3'-phosphodiesterase